MAFSEWTDDLALASRLEKIIKEGRLFHACIFEGEDSAVSMVVDDVIRAFLCESQTGDSCGHCKYCRKYDSENMEGIFKIKKNGNILVSDIESLIAETNRKLFTGKSSFFVIYNAERMTVQSQNKLLKTLEEPPQNTKIFLATANSERLLPTIRSRCVLFRVQGKWELQRRDNLLTDDENESVCSLADKIMYDRPLYRMRDDIEYFTQKGKNRTEGFISAFELILRDAVVIKYRKIRTMAENGKNTSLSEKFAGSFESVQLIAAVDSCEEAMKRLRANGSARYVLKNMIFDIQGKMRI